MAAVRIESFPCNHSINAVLTGLASKAADKGFRRNSKQKLSTSGRNCIKTRKKHTNQLFLQHHFAFTLSTLVKYVMILSRVL